MKAKNSQDTKFENVNPLTLSNDDAKRGDSKTDQPLVKQPPINIQNVSGSQSGSAVEDHVSPGAEAVANAYQIIENAAVNQQANSRAEKELERGDALDQPLVLKDAYTEAVAAGVVSGSVRDGSDLNSKFTSDQNKSKDLNQETNVPLEYTQTLEASKINKQIEQSEIDGVNVNVLLDKHHKNVVSSIELVKMGDPLENNKEEKPSEKKATNDYINQPSSGSGSAKNIKTLLQNEQVNSVTVSAKSSGQFARPPPIHKPSNHSIPEQMESLPSQSIENTTPSKDKVLETSLEKSQLTSNILTDQTKQTPKPTDPADELLHKLPTNYFVQDDDEEDLDAVMTNIQNMRKDMLNYVQENDMDSKMQKELQNIANINDIIQPQKFVERHFQVPEQSGSTPGQNMVNADLQASFDVEPPQYMFESILKEKPIAVQKEELQNQLKEEQKFESQHDPESPKLRQNLSPEFGNQNEQTKSPEFAGANVESPNFMGEPSLNTFQNEEPLLQSSKKGSQPKKSIDFWGNDDASEQQNNAVQLQLFQERTSQQDESSFIEKQEGDSFNEATEFKVADDRSGAMGSEANAESTHTPLVGITSGPRIMKMADYFNKQAEVDASSRLTNDQNQPQSQPLLAKGGQPQQSDQFEKQLEEDILKNVDINFLFFKGKNLQDGLIDSKRLHQIMNKIKELAKAQLASGSKDIDYQQLIEFLKNKDLGFVADETNEDFQEPVKGDGSKEEQAQWNSVIDFMRSNPKLLMQMIPDPEDAINGQFDSECVLQADQVLKRSRAYDKIKQAQKYQKLQKLSQNFISKRVVNQNQSENQSRPFSGYMSQKAVQNEQSRFMSLSSVNSGATGPKQNQGPLSLFKQHSSLNNPKGYLSSKNTQNNFFQTDQVSEDQVLEKNQFDSASNNKRERQKSANSFASAYGQRNYMSSYSSTFGNQMAKRDTTGLPPRKTAIMSAKTDQSQRANSKNMVRSRIMAPSILADLKSEQQENLQKEKTPIASRQDEQFKMQKLKPITNAYSHIPSRVYDSKPKYQAPLNDKTNYQLPAVARSGRDQAISQRSNAKNSGRVDSQKKGKIALENNDEKELEINGSVGPMTNQSANNTNAQIDLFQKNPKFVAIKNASAITSEQNDVGRIGQQNVIRFNKAPRPTTAKGVVQQRAVNMPPIRGTPGKRGAVNTSQILQPGKLDTSLNNPNNFSQNSIFNGVESSKYRQKSQVGETNKSRGEALSSKAPKAPKFIKARDFNLGNQSQNKSQEKVSRKVIYQACKYEPILNQSKGTGQKLTSSLSAAGVSQNQHQRLKEKVATENMMMFQSLSSKKELEITEQKKSSKNIQSQKLNQSNQMDQASFNQDNKKQQYSPQIRYPAVQHQVSPNRYTPKPLKNLSRSRSRSKSHKSRNSIDSPIRRQILTGTGGNPTKNNQTSTTQLEHQANVKFSHLADKSDKRAQSSKFAKSKSKSPARMSSAKSYGKKSDKRTNVAQKCEMSVQTEIRGIEHYIQIRPDKFDSDPFLDKSDLGQVAENDPLNLSQNASTIMSEKKGNLPHYKVPVINWSDSEVYNTYLQNPSSTHVLSGEANRYTEGEVDYVLDMIKKSYNDFKRTDIMKPFYMKALDTLKFLLEEQSIAPIFERVAIEYKEITLENTMKLLIRCKLAFSSRNSLITIFQLIAAYDLEMEEIKRLIDTVESHKIGIGEFTQIQLQAKKVMEAARKALQQAESLRQSSHRQFKNKSFIFKNKDMVIFIKKELTHIRRIISSFKVSDPNSAQSNFAMDDYITLLPNEEDLPDDGQN